MSNAYRFDNSRIQGNLTTTEAQRQAIVNAILTPKGSLPVNPSFGSNFWQYLQMSATVALPLMRAEIYRVFRDTFSFDIGGANVDIKQDSTDPTKFYFEVLLASGEKIL